ncbi:putative clustered mitochondria protein [Helianthus annuus]|nr:putative clustered mitochondria protein [Helianthus annuus]KAJ0587559.1 putative clustered mitochondria protein [Helianthus annuus]KAJ0756710.1 putative clustered mitochondria protein [Helianthus annuus]KAJ0760460.1 putative clustered mitochondria protein [Helianthus annuus]
MLMGSSLRLRYRLLRRRSKRLKARVRRVGLSKIKFCFFTAGDIHLFPVPVKTQFGEKLEFQLSPSDSIMDVRQFLLHAPGTCFFSCYVLLLHINDGSAHHLEDYHEISEVADITSGGCSLEMIAALYDDRSIRAHVHRTRELLSLSTLHSSLSTSLALQHEMGQNATANSGGLLLRKTSLIHYYLNKLFNY